MQIANVCCYVVDVLTDLANGSRKVAVVSLARDHEIDGSLDVALGRGVVLEVARHAEQHQQHA